MVGAQLSRKRKAYWQTGRKNAMSFKRAKVSPGKKALSELARLKRTLRQEIKAADWADTTAVSSIGDVDLITVVTQGDDQSERIGTIVNGKDLFIQGKITKHASATNSFVRYIVFSDRQQEADTVPATTVVLNSDDFESLYDITNTERGVGLSRVNILMDKKFSLTASDPTALFELTIPWKKQVMWTGAANGTQLKNHLYLLKISTEATNTVSSDIRGRFRYTD